MPTPAVSRAISRWPSATARGTAWTGRGKAARPTCRRAALSAIINGLVRLPDRVVLVFDNYELVDTPAVAAFLRSLIRLAPSGCHFVVATRDYPRLDQATLAAGGQLLELTARDLAFTNAEARAMLLEENALEPAVVQAIIERTEGWPVALQLTCLSLGRGMDPRELIERFGGASPDLTRYLSEQVLRTLPPESRETVQRTSLLDRLTGEAVNLLCDCEDGWLRLERLERHGVLLSSASSQRTAYRYHPLLTE